MSITKENLSAAVTEAKRFLDAAEKVTEEHLRYGGATTATCRRASMDLTRALAAMRNEGRSY